MYLHLLGITPQMLLALQQGTRLKGSLGFNSDGTLNFHPWRIAPPEPHAYRRLRHGKISVSAHRIRLRLEMDRREKAVASDVLWRDTSEALSFVEDQIKEEQDENLRGNVPPDVLAS